MKAIVFSKYGPPDLLEKKEIEKPVPKSDEVLIKVHAASVNPLDWHIMRGAPKFARVSFGLFKPKVKSLGADVAGMIVETGKNVTKFKTFDEVFGELGLKYIGSFAEYVLAKEEHILLKPSNISFLESAAVPVTALTALQGLRDKGKIKPGMKVLVNGASGGVGTMAVQIAKSFNTDVTGVCSSKNLDMVQSIGADYVIDYTQSDFTKNGQHYDLIYDAVGNRSINDLKRGLTPNGICVIAGYTNMGLMLQHAIKGPIISKRNGKQLGMMETAKMVPEDLEFVKKLIEHGHVKPVIDKVYSLEDVHDAIKYLETGRARGKVVIDILRT